MSTVIQQWHRIMDQKDPAGLKQLLADEVVFHSPVVHRPQEGKAITQLYLTAAMQTLNASGQFRYLREIIDGHNAVLEFQTELDGILINGVDMIQWNDDGQIVDFKVMVRPLKAVNAIHQAMGRMLEQIKSK
ncbi:MAG: nuclear transport factor 2 family protein [Halomonadaceae bacterium]|nr:MAG: nuclear transport factor 2 family protein [Halomonadaceae bacterium]